MSLVDTRACKIEIYTTQEANHFNGGCVLSELIDLLFLNLMARIVMGLAGAGTLPELS